MSIYFFILIALLLFLSLILLVYGFSTPIVQSIFILFYVWIDGAYFGWWGFTAVLLAAIAAEVVEFFAGVKGAKKAHGADRSAWGAILGGFAGAALGSPFLFPLGSILGSFLGTFVGAFIFQWTVSANAAHAVKVGYWAFMGKTLGFGVKVSISIAILISFVGSGIVQMIRS